MPKLSMETSVTQKPKLNTFSALITGALYLVGSIVAGVLAAFFLLPGATLVGEDLPDRVLDI